MKMSGIQMRSALLGMRLNYSWFNWIFSGHMGSPSLGLPGVECEVVGYLAIWILGCNLGLRVR